MNALIREIYQTGIVEDAQGEKYEAFPAAITHDDGEALYRVMRDFKAKRSLETGMAYGLSSLFLMQGLIDNGGEQHVSIDPYQTSWWHNVGLANVERAGFSGRHRFFCAPSFDAMPELLKTDERFDVIFIDGNHRFEYSLIDFHFADRLLNKNGALILHDPWMPSIKKTISFILRNRDESYEIAPEYGIAKYSRWHALKNFLRAMRENPCDVAPARFFSAHSTHNYCVFRKIRHIDQEEMDRTWDCYNSF